ncbi:MULTISPECIES: Zn-dependent hydrolase [Rhizobium/Agrobacterium group]|uniref:Hydrolase/MSMEI_3903 n=4 Tax=Rhizobium/Agrobacterium group TaxID=227290 RepID=A8VZZ9_RHIRH|nr:MULTISPECIES: Zn-dependent hydrolase [Rhizobium/Agrobacterium group]ABW33594.1 rcorf37 [Rhizobium rhizogenes]AQS65498.1 Zn-dependent hydrolase [Rhizobium rhizogenes]ASK42082.1 Zn-dependent hydrolase [Rhizobium rhizogenes]MCZ7445869.1 Zn-dependent hydrolase [Rhizobium rhizogenes]MCZ7472620.1 Zn-dependent hydrolase [Rhizobium rhizogenes]
MLDAATTRRTDFDAIFDRISAIGAHPGAGVTRLAASAEDGMARGVFAVWMEQAAVQIANDAIGNQFACFDWAGQDAPWIFAGSHLDTQPRGGRFDGTLGVLTAGQAALAIHAEVQRGLCKPRYNLAVVNWTNEEGARYQPSLTGSTVFSGALALGDALELRDGDGVSLKRALEAIGVSGSSGIVPPPPKAYVELHVEQGRKLLEAGRKIGVVEGTWAARKKTVRWIGRAAHTGPTPMADRRDALLAAARGIAAFEAVVAASHPLLHRSAARLVVEPNSPNVVVDRATVWFELRGPDVAELDMAGELALAALEKAAAETGTQLEIVADTLRDPASMDRRLMALVDRTARSCGFEPLTMRSVAGHDAVALQNSGIPSALIFIPSVDGIAHHPDELTEPQDVQAGLAVLTATLRNIIEGEFHAG